MRKPSRFVKGSWTAKKLGEVWVLDGKNKKGVVVDVSRVLGVRIVRVGGEKLI
jgi:hypothetical protein